MTKRFKTLEEAIEAHKYFENTCVCDNWTADTRIKRVTREIEPKSRFLDVGCNDGVFGIYIKNLFGCDVYGVDVSNYAKFWAIRNGLKFYHCPVEKMPFKDSFFDIVNASEVLEHCFDAETSVKEIHRVIKKSGVFVGTVPHPDLGIKEYPRHQRIMTREYLKGILSKYFKHVLLENIVGNSDYYNDNGELVGKYRGKNTNLFFKANN
jgi:ubiquinone/menaquinone biosynthesis C-methylase UbiE